MKGLPYSKTDIEVSIETTTQEDFQERVENKLIKAPRTNNLENKTVKEEAGE
jgi:hypothetical protein